MGTRSWLPTAHLRPPARTGAAPTHRGGRPLRRGFLPALLPVLLLAAGCAPAAVDGYSVWPEELRIRGAVLLLGEGLEPEAVRARFLELAGGEQARVVELAEPAEASRLDPAALATATGAWLSGAPASAADDGDALPDPLLGGLRGVIERGGVVALPAAVGAHLAEALVTSASGVAGQAVIPGVLLHPRLEGAAEHARLLSLLEAHPRLFGIGVPPGAALEVNGRRLSAAAGEIVLLVPQGGGRPAREERLSAGAAGRGNVADLTAWRREAIERTLPPFPGQSPRPPHVASGALVIVGGGSVPSAVTAAFIEAAGGPQARLVFIPPEEGDSVPDEPAIVRNWRQAGVASATWLHTKDRRRADGDADFLRPLEEATGIWFGGGRQWNFSDSYYGTAAHRLMHEVLARGGVVGGTSAGASIQAEWMARGDPLGNQNILAHGYERGLGFISGVAIDQHFSQRGRHGDMEELMGIYPQLLGIGIDESTALVVRGSVAEVIGDGRVFIYDRRRDRTSPPTVLGAGSAYDLRERRVVRQGAQPAG